MKKTKMITAVLCSCLLCLGIVLTGCSGGNESAVKEESEASAKTGYTDQVFDLERNDIDLYLARMTSDSVEVQDNILLVHGLTYSSHEFDVNYKDYSLVRFLCDQGYAVWRIDIAGYGQSERVEDGFMVDSDYAAEDIGAAIEKILEVTGAETIDLLGWSWGTVTSSRAEEKYSEVIDKYVLYAPILTGLGSDDVTTDYHENSWEHAASDFQIKEDGSIDTNIVEQAMVDTYFSNCWRIDAASSPNGGRRDLLVDPSVELIDLSKIKDPTLVICGDRDPYMNMPLVEASKEQLPEGSVLKIIEGGAHAVLLEKPYYREFREELINFLKE